MKSFIDKGKTDYNLVGFLGEVWSSEKSIVMIFLL